MIPRLSTAEDVSRIRLEQFAAFSASVEVGLREYNDKAGPEKLMNDLLARYCDKKEKLNSYEAREYKSDTLKLEREEKEARRQIVLLFGLLSTYQPTELITKVLSAIDNATVTEIELYDGGSGYAPGYGAPEVTVDSPQAGKEYVTATARAVMQGSGRVLRVDMKERGYGYKKAPDVEVSVPLAMKKAESTSSGPASNQLNSESNATTVYNNPLPDAQTFKRATAKAILSKKGCVERIEVSDESREMATDIMATSTKKLTSFRSAQITDPGFGYSDAEPIKITFSPPDVLFGEGGISPTATAILELEVAQIIITNGGSGYAAEKAVIVNVAPPPVTSRINLMDERLITKKRLEQFEAQAEEVAKSKINECAGRACYDRQVICIGKTTSSVDSYSGYRTEKDNTQTVNAEIALQNRGVGEKKPKPKPSKGKGKGKGKIRGDDAGTGSQAPFIPAIGGGDSASAQLLTLLPTGIGLQYQKTDKRYILASALGNTEDTLGAMSVGSRSANPRPLDPEVSEEPCERREYEPLLN